MKRSHKISIHVIVTILALSAVVLFFVFSRGEQALGILEMTKNGGKYTNDEVLLYMPPRAESQQAKLEVFEKPSLHETNPNIFFQSKMSYGIRGKAKSFGTDIIVQFKVPSKILNSVDSLAAIESHLVIVAQLHSKVVGGNIPVESNLILPTKFLAKDTSAHAIFSLSGIDTSLLEFAPSFHLRFYSESLLDVKSSPIDSDASPLFTAIIDKKLNPANVRDALSMLEKQKYKLNMLRFRFDGVSMPVNVQFRDLGSDVQVQYVEPLGFSGRGWLEINQNQGFTPSTADMTLSELFELSSGTELMLFCGAIYDVPNWITRSVATWYEPVFASESGYFPYSLLRKSQFIKTALFHPEWNYTDDDDLNNRIEMEQSFGFGWFIGFASVFQDNAFFAERLFRKIKDNKKQKIEEIISNLFGDLSLRQIYPQMLQTMMLECNSLWANIKPNEIEHFLVTDSISAIIGYGSKLPVINWRYDHLEDGKYVSTLDDNSLHIAQEFQNLSARIYKICFNSSDEEVRRWFRILNKEITIKLKGNQDVGVMLYKRKGNSWIAFADANNFIKAAQKTSFTLLDDSDLLVILFDNNPNSEAHLSSAEVDVAVAYRNPEKAILARQKSEAEISVPFVGQWRGKIAVNELIMSEQNLKISASLDILPVKRTDKNSEIEGRTEVKIAVNDLSKSVYEFDVRYKKIDSNRFQITSINDGTSAVRFSAIFYHFWEIKKLKTADIIEIAHFSLENNLKKPPLSGIFRLKK